MHADKNLLGPGFSADAGKKGFHLHITLGIERACFDKALNCFKILFLIINIIGFIDADAGVGEIA